MVRVMYATENNIDYLSGPFNPFPYTEIAGDPGDP